MEVLKRVERKHDLEELQRLQTDIASKVILEDCFKKPIKIVTGFDLAYLERESIAAAVTFDYDTLQIIEKKTIKERTTFPYIPTFLSFREGPIIIKLVQKLKIKPDMIMLDSQGISHPLFCGCASYVGVLIEKPAIGVAKSKLCGEITENPRKNGEWISLRYQGRKVGAVLLSKRRCNPIFVSPGHMITIETAVNIVKHFLVGYKIPEPTRLAHNFANKIKKDLSLSRKKE